MKKALKFRYSEQTGEEMTQLLHSNLQKHIESYQSYSFYDLSYRALGSLQLISSPICTQNSQLCLLISPRITLSASCFTYILSFLDRKSMISIRMVNKSMCLLSNNSLKNNELSYQVDMSKVANNIRRAANPVGAVNAPLEMDIGAQWIENSLIPSTIHASAIQRNYLSGLAVFLGISAFCILIYSYVNFL